MKDVKKIIIAALFAALTCVTTMVIKLPTPTTGYVHPGDGMVLLSGILLGPATGGLAAGIGSMLADLFSGYASFAPGTLVIKALSAGAAGLLYRAVPCKHTNVRIALAGFSGEVLMVAGYYAYEIGLTMLAGSGLAAALTACAAGIPFNIAQGASGILIAFVLYPALLQVPIFRQWMKKQV